MCLSAKSQNESRFSEKIIPRSQYSRNSTIICYILLIIILRHKTVKGEVTLAPGQNMATSQPTLSFPAIKCQ